MGLRCSCFSLCHRDRSCLGCLSGLVFCRRDPWLRGERDRCHRLLGLCLRGSVLLAILYLGGALLDSLYLIQIFTINKDLFQVKPMTEEKKGKEKQKVETAVL